MKKDWTWLKKGWKDLAALIGMALLIAEFYLIGFIIGIGFSIG